MKGYLKCGADGGSWGNICARALVELLYDDAALDAARKSWSDFTASDVETVRMAVATDGLQVRIVGRCVSHASETLKIAAAGLKSRPCWMIKAGMKPNFWPLYREIVATGKTHADIMLKKYHAEWG